MRRKSLPFLCCLGLLAAGVPAQSDEVIQDALITQTSSDYIYWNAEDFDRLEFPDGGLSWRVLSSLDPGSVSGKTLQAQPSGQDTGGGNDSFAIFKFDFTSPGDHGHRIKILAKQELFEKTGVPGGFFSLLLQTGFRSVSLQQRDCEPS